MNRSHHQSRRYSVENKSNPITKDIHNTPNFKSSSVIEHSFDTNQDLIDQLYDFPAPHKSFDLSHHITSSKNPSKPLTSRRSASTKRNRASESVILETLQQPSTAVDSQRKSMRSSISFRSSSVIGGSTARGSEIANSQPATRMNSGRENNANNKPVMAVPIMDASRKKAEMRNSISGSTREMRNSISGSTRDLRESSRITEDLYQHEMNDRSHEFLIKYKSLLGAYEDLNMRNKQVEESLRMEVLRGEEQRAYIDILKNKMEEYDKKLGSKIAMEIEATQRENGIRNERARMFQEMSGLGNEIEMMRDTENKLRNELGMYQEKINEVSMEKEMLENHIAHFQKTSSDLDKEVKKLADMLFSSKKECARLQEENKHLSRNGENEALKQRLQDIMRSYDDLKMLNEETDKQRRVIANALEEEGEIRNQLEQEKENILHEKDRLEMAVDEQANIAEEYQQKFEILTENYSILRMTLNETEAELQGLKEVIESTEKVDKVNIEEVQSLKETTKELMFSLQTAEDLKARALRDKETVERELEVKKNEIERLKVDVESMRVNTRQIIKEYEGWEVQKRKLLAKIKSLGGEMSRFENDTSMLSEEGVEDIVKKHENRERLIKTLKDQVTILEKENVLLKNSQQNHQGSSYSVEKYKEENNILSKKNEFLIKKLHEIVEAQNQAQSTNTQLKDKVNVMKRVFFRIEKEMTEIIDNSPLHQNLEEMGNDTLRGLAYQEGDEEKDWNQLEILVKRVKKEMNKMNDRYTQAKMDLVHQMQRCEDIENRDENSYVLKEKVQRLNGELSNVTQENGMLKRNNENLNKKLMQVGSQMQSLNREVETLKNKENNVSSFHIVKDSGNPLELKLKEAMIRRQNAFIFNTDVKEILDEITNIEAQIIKTSVSHKQPGSKQSLRGGSLTSLSTNANDQAQTCSTIKDDQLEADETLDAQKARKDLLEMELSKLEVEERKRYDSIDMIEKQNFELKNELSRLMNGLEINLSQYRDNKSEYFSKRMDDRFAFSNGYDLTMSELENRKLRSDVIHYDAEQAEADEDHYYS
jgi:chromosome segregation ATPase